ncbi:MAG: glycogen/starch synthase [Bacteroidales bacterium]|nr:glycogen/starch synthase [Bacteroidales bacterium]MDD4528681.1 glycogen/starch synthase [Bacteroidales bacterium]MDD4830033.1 glycogen/starch synthase [Bacteroidales bacterium]
MKGRILFVNQEISPYLKETKLSLLGRYLPQYIQENGKEIRTFMPRFGNVNERKNQLHEVIRLSGINLIIDRSDHPLIIKVASIQQARMQVYFIDNEDYFQRKYDLVDEKETLFIDNDERVIFYSRGVLETIKKLNWKPNIVHCSGWFSSLMPFYIKRTDYKNNPLFGTSKIVLTLVDDEFAGSLHESFMKKLKADGGTVKDWTFYKEPDYLNYMMAAISYSDGIVLASENVNPKLIEFAKQNKKQIVEYAPLEEQYPHINALYDKIIVLDEE